MDSFFKGILEAVYLQVVAGSIALLLVSFLSYFLARGVRHFFRIRKILVRLRGLEPNAPIDEYRAIFSVDKRMDHLWSEYADTLHEQKEDRDGIMRTLAYRATIPSETYFSSQYVVDSRLGVEFFKHLPGIFTGIGIIGTFLGLINGLKKFHVTSDPAKTIEMIQPLMGAVQHAFGISAAAIIAAMVVTVLEKLLINALYVKTEEICHVIDARFDTGAGEEYLSRLVTASEDSASQSKILKDALVSELGDILREISASQTAAMQASNRDLGGLISGSIETSLKEPLSRIESAFKDVQGGQSERTVQMLGDVMAGFSQRLNELFGGQISGINELNRQSSETMREAVASLRTLVGDLGSQGKMAAEQMAEKMAESIAEMERRQADINARTEVILTGIAQQMSGVMTSVAESQAHAIEANRDREAQMADRASTLVGGMTESVEALMQEIASASQAMSTSVDKLTNATTSSIDKMNLGAEKISDASAKFVASGGRVSEVMDKAAQVSAKLSEVAGQMSVSSSALTESLRDYQTQRQALSGLLDSTKTTIELARREAGVTENVLQRIESSAAKLAQVQVDFEAYLDGVSDTLEESSRAFQGVVKTTLQQVNTDFHDQLTNSVKLLKAAIDELEGTLAGIGSGR